MGRPWIVAIALALVAAAGATAVYIGGSRIAAGDRNAIVAWERAAADILDEPHRVLERLHSLTRDLPHTPARASLRRAERVFERAAAHLSAIDTPPILRRTADEFLVFLERAADPARELDRTSEPDVAAIVESVALYQRARETLITLRCRARLASCGDTLLPPAPTVS